MKKTRKLKTKHPVQRQMLDDLSFNLNCEVLAYRELLQLASKIQNALLSDESDLPTVRYGEQILIVASQQAKLARKLQAHEETRISLCEKLAASFALPFVGEEPHSPVPPEQVSLSQLISLVPEPYATKYVTFRNELNSLISKLDVLCFQNARLISNNIQYINEMLGILATLGKDSNSISTYTNTGKINNSQYNPRVLDFDVLSTH